MHRLNLVPPSQPPTLGDAQFRELVEGAPDGVFFADPQGRYVYVNQAGCRMLGLSGSEVIGRTAMDFVHPDEVEALEQSRLAMLAGGAHLGIWRLRQAGGGWLPVEITANRLADGHSQGYVRDISQRIAHERARTELLERSERDRALFATIFSLLPVGVWIADRDGHITLANEAGTRLWEGVRHVGPDRYTEYRAWWLDTGLPIAPDDWGIARAVRRGETSKSELIRIQCFDGSYKTVINWAAPIRSDAGEITGAVAVNEDVTTLHRTQEQLRAAVRDREHILAVVAHDLRNPLGNLMLHADLAEQYARAAGAGESADAVASVTSIAGGMASLVDDLMVISSQGRAGYSMLQIALVRPQQLAVQAAAFARPRFEQRGLQLVVRADAEVPEIAADGTRILRVLGNLLDNAAKFTERGGNVVIEVQEAASSVRFCVSNSGTPLRDEQRERLFQPFWQAGHEDRRGVGLGLSICRSMVEAHGGTIWTEPAPGMRLKVAFLLPRARPLG